MVITKREDVTKQGFCKNTLKKTPSSRNSLISNYSVFFGCEGEGEWVLVVGAYLSLSGKGRGGRLLTFSAFRMGAFSR